MRPVRAVVIATVALAVVLLAGPQAALAEIGPSSGAGSQGNQVYANAVRPGARGGAGAHGVGCHWQPVWGNDSPIEVLGQLLSSIIFGTDIPPDATVEVVPDGGTPQTGDTTITPVLGDAIGRSPEDIVAGSYKGRNVNFINAFVLYVLGTHPLGVFQENQATATYLQAVRDANGLVVTDGTIQNEILDNYHDNGAYPAILRGEDWWDPWYVSLEDGVKKNASGNCPSGLIYVPRNSDARAFIPDVQKLFTDLLPPAEAKLQPLDKDYGWAYVQVPTDFSSTAASLVPPVASAEIPDPINGGTVWIEATAIPTYLVFNPGDGNPAVVCDVADAHYDPTTPSACSYTYLDASSIAPGGAFNASLTILWRGSYESSSGPGTFAVSPTRVNFPVEVAEARAVGVVGR